MSEADSEENNMLIKVVILVSLGNTRYSLQFIMFLLYHYDCMDHFNKVFTTFLDLDHDAFCRGYQVGLGLETLV